MGLRIRLLGSMTIEIDGRPIAVASKKARALLGYLALREGAEVSRGVLTGLLWGERSESQARASLRQTLSELRAALGTASQSITANKETVAWVAASAWIDAKVVETAAGCADHDALRDAAELIASASRSSTRPRIRAPSPPLASAKPLRRSPSPTPTPSPELSTPSNAMYSTSASS
jgi:DNA-binding SARP family transcriptional activator